MKARTQQNKISSDQERLNEIGQSICVIERSIHRSGLTRDSFVRILTETAFGKLQFWTQTDLERLLLAAESLGLSPLNGDIYAASLIDSGDKSGETKTEEFESELENQTSPINLVISLQGWMRMVNSHPQFHGITFKESDSELNKLPEWMECSIFRKDLQLPVTVKEYMSEANQMTGAWISHPRRMLRHRSLIQCAKLAFGFPQFLALDFDGETKCINTSSQIKNEITLKVGTKRPAQCNELKSWLAHKHTAK